MNKIVNPNKQNWLQLTLRPTAELSKLESIVKQIFDEIIRDGDEAVKKYSRLYDKADFDSLVVNEKDITNASTKVSEELKQAIQLAKSNIEKFHASQRESLKIIEPVK